MEIKNLSSDKFVSIESFEFKSAIGCHDQCELVALINEKDAGCFNGLLNKTVGLKDKNFDWTGIVVESELMSRVEGIYVRVRLNGLTVKHDKSIRNRIFQQPEKTFNDIFGAMKLEGATLIGEGKNTKVPGIQIQDGETDFEFLKRLTAALGLRLFAESKGALKFIAGEFISNAQKNLKVDKIKIWSQTESADGNRLVLSTDENLNVGEKISVGGKTFIVEKKRIVNESTRFVQYCQLKECKKIDAAPSTVEKILSATVAKNDDPNKSGRVQVDFVEPFDDVLKSDRAWIEMCNDYSSGDKGLIFIPNVGDAVSVCVRNGVGSYISARRDKKIGAPFDSPDKKYLIWGDKQFIELNNDALILKNNDATITVGKDKIEIAVGDKNKITVDKNAINLSVGDNKFLVDKNRILSEIKKTAVELTDAVKVKSGDVKIESRSSMEMSGGSVKIKGRGGVDIN